MVQGQPEHQVMHPMFPALLPSIPANGHRPPARLSSMLSGKRRGLANEKAYAGQLGPNEWWLPKLAEEVPVSTGKLANWTRRGWVHSRKSPAQRLCVLWADKPELK